MAAAPRRWTAEEDRILREGGLAQSPDGSGSICDWDKIAKNLPGRSNKDCRKRWLNVVAGGLRKGAWTSYEDSQLQEGVKEFGSSWTAISKLVGTRSADQCSKRWQQCLNPALDHSRWTAYENALLIKAMAYHGTNWSIIQKLHFPERSSNNIKNQRTNLSRQPQWQEQFSLVTSPCCSSQFNHLDSTYPTEYIATPSSSIDAEVDYCLNTEEDTSIPPPSRNPLMRATGESLLRQPRDQNTSTLNEAQMTAPWFTSSNSQGHLEKPNDEPISWLPQGATSYPVERSNFGNELVGSDHSSTAGVPTLDCCSQTTTRESSGFDNMEMSHPDTLLTMVEGSSNMNDNMVDRRPQTVFTIFGPHDETILDLTRILIQSKKEWHMTQML